MVHALWWRRVRAHRTFGIISPVDQLVEGTLNRWRLWFHLIFRQVKMNIIKYIKHEYYQTYQTSILSDISNINIIKDIKHEYYQIYQTWTLLPKCSGRIIFQDKLDWGIKRSMVNSISVQTKIFVWEDRVSSWAKKHSVSLVLTSGKYPKALKEITRRRRMALNDRCPDRSVASESFFAVSD